MTDANVDVSLPNNVNVESTPNNTEGSNVDKNMEDMLRMVHESTRKETNVTKPSFANVVTSETEITKVNFRKIRNLEIK